MILFRIATGFFIWDVYKWLSVFLLAAIILGFFISAAVRVHGGRLVREDRARRMEYSGVFDIERFAAAITKLTVEPWAEMPACGLICLAALVLFFAAAIFLR
ncbi:MAG: hypothetical protein RR501_06485 [Cloacibacillus sp.]